MKILQILILLLFVTSAKAEVKIIDPTLVKGKETCVIGYYLIAKGACLKTSDITKYSPDQISQALMARKNPKMAKKYEEALAYRKEHGIKVYKTTIDSEHDDILKLTNGGIVEVTFGYIGYIGYGKKVILYPEGASWKIWIEDNNSFTVDILKSPTSAPQYVTTMTEILDLVR